MKSTASLRERADLVLSETVRSLFEEIDTDKLREEVAELRRASPQFDPVEQADLLARRTALRCAAAGAITGLPAGLFAVATLGADLAYLMYQQFRLILGIATIYGYEPSQRERMSEVMNCLAYGSGVGLGKQGLAVVLQSAVGEKIGLRLVRDSFSRFVPVLGAVSGGMVNYMIIRAVGRSTIRYYEAKIDPALADEIWSEGDREHA